ncbi:hypothetical protein BVRB_6g138260 [Beta vulgaris subsp. vulgaris]|nr:hypothetical protein BVRB_6g138260 [Beta vulgaris subsp. vulgaris]
MQPTKAVRKPCIWCQKQLLVECLFLLCDLSDLAQKLEVCQMPRSLKGSISLP